MKIADQEIEDWLMKNGVRPFGRCFVCNKLYRDYNNICPKCGERGWQRINDNKPVKLLRSGTELGLYD